MYFTVSIYQYQIDRYLQIFTVVCTMGAKEATVRRTGKPFTVWLPDELAQKLEAAAYEQRRTKRTLVLLALERFFEESSEEEKSPMKRKKGGK